MLMVVERDIGNLLGDARREKADHIRDDEGMLNHRDTCLYELGVLR